MAVAEKRYTTISGVPIEPLYGPEQLRDFDPRRELAVPGEFPYTRGIHETMYRGRLWTMRQFSGFATPEETNRRYHYLLQQGQTGLSVAFDLPTLMGYDADHGLAEGEGGKCGASISSLEDMEILFRGIRPAATYFPIFTEPSASLLLAFGYAIPLRKERARGPAQTRKRALQQVGRQRLNGPRLSGPSAPAGSLTPGPSARALRA